MLVLTTADEILQVMRHVPHRTRVGFVATMGGLHSGHMALVTTSVQECDCTIVSIFLNPTQFAPHEDLDSYPRTFQNDIAMCREHGVDYVFAPSPDHVYPSQFGTFVETDVGKPDRNTHAEGAARPTFFRGVATVVTKLLVLIRPNMAYFGRKDAQQCAVVRNLVRDLWLCDTEIKLCDIVREKDGLAMSSRNAYLSQVERKHASLLYATLCHVTALAKDGERNTNTLRKAMTMYVAEWTQQRKPPDVYFQLAYVSICVEDTMQEIEHIAPDNVTCIACIAAIMGKTRLIDNMALEFGTS